MDIAKALKVYFVMGSINCLNLDPEKTLHEALNGGITLFQYREKGKGSLIGSDCLYLGNKLRKLCKEYKVPFIVNDDIDLAIELNAEGIHIGQDDTNAEIARKKLGDKKWIGVSTHSIAEAQRAIKDRADYIGVGPMFSTKTKVDAHEVVGPTLLSEMRATKELCDFPIVGIGGITLENTEFVYRAGANGVAVISGISQMDSPKEAAATFHKFIDKSHL